jgi:hypothetical protein
VPSVVPDPAQGNLVARLQCSDIANELFLPAEVSVLKPAKSGEPVKYELLPNFKDRVKRERHGVRLQAYDPKSEFPNQNVRLDLKRVIDSLAVLRKEESFHDFCLGPATLTAQTEANVQRALFGFEGGSTSEEVCARRSHHAIINAMYASGHRLHPAVPAFDPKAGLAGLGDWCNTVELNKRKKWPLWPLLLLPLLLLLIALIYYPKQPPQPLQFLDTEVETENIIVLFDVSGSMKTVQNDVRNKSAEVLNTIVKNNKNYHIDYIAFSETDASLFHRLTKIDAKARNTILAWLRRKDYGTGNDNHYKAGFKTAFTEAMNSAKPTTIIFLSDGQIPLVQEAIQPGRTQQQQLDHILSEFSAPFAERVKIAVRKKQIILNIPKIYRQADEVAHKMRALSKTFNGRLETDTPKIDAKENR